MRRSTVQSLPPHLAFLGSVDMVCEQESVRAQVGEWGSAITNGREPRSFLGQGFNFKLGSFTDNTKIADHANSHF